ncbi:UNVERIFIED_ORG: urea transporter [Rhodococcus erythropolis]
MRARLQAARAHLRALIPAAARGRVYVTATALVALLHANGLISEDAGDQWAALAIAVVTLMFAILHSTSKVRTALYSAALAVQGVAQVYGVWTDTQWAGVLALVAALLGISVAAARTPTGSDAELQALIEYAPNVIVSNPPNEQVPD